MKQKIKKYKIFAGLSGGFGGAEELYIDEFISENEACDIAYIEAVQIYESYEGMYGLSCMQDIIERISEENIDEWTEEEIQDYAEAEYLEEMEGWLDYHIEEVEEYKDDLLNK